MTEIVIVALIGVVGTLLGGVVGPLMKERLDRRAKRRDETHKEIGEILAKVDALLMKMLRLNPAAPGTDWWETRQKAAAEISRLSYLLGKGEGEVAAVLDWALMHASPGGTKATKLANRSLVNSSTNKVAAWYRGERSPKGLTQEAIDVWQMMFDGAVSGRIRPDGEKVDPSELDDSERQRLVEIEEQGGLEAMARRRARRFWRIRR